MLLKSLNQNVSIPFMNNIYIGNIRAVCHKNYTWKLVIVLNLYEFSQFVLSDILSLKCANTSLHPKIRQEAKCANTVNLYTTEKNGIGVRGVTKAIITNKNSTLTGQFNFEPFWLVTIIPLQKIQVI